MVQGVEALFLSCIAGKHFGLPVSGAIAAHVCILACVLDLLKEKKKQPAAGLSTKHQISMGVITV